MKIKTSELTGPALDWAVAKCEGENYRPITTYNGIGHEFPPTDYSTDWSQGGPIIEREGINTFKYNKLSDQEPNKWCGHKVVPRQDMEGSTCMVAIALDGPTPLIAAMRCFVTSRLGDEVEVPDELMENA